MNLWVKGKGLLAFIMLIAFATSCEEEENEIGLPVENTPDLRYFEYDVPVNMIWVDSVISRNTGTIYAGSFDFEEAGQVKAQSFIPFIPQFDTSRINIPSSAQFLDYYLRLDYATAVSNGEDSEQSLQVYQLADSISQTGQYYIEDKEELGALLGEKTFTFYADSVDSAGYEERIILDESIGMLLLDKLKSKDAAYFKSDTAFRAQFKGLGLVPGENNTAILGFDPSTSRMVVEYTFTNNSNVLDTGSFVFLPNSYFYNNITPNKIEQNLEGSVFSDVTCCYEPYTPAGDLVYQLFGSGINIQLDLSAFRNFDDSLQAIMVNAAVLELNNVEATVPAVRPPSTILFFLTDEFGTRTEEPISGIPFYQTLVSEQAVAQAYNPLLIGNPAVLAYNTGRKQYKVSIPLFLESIIENEEVPAHLLLENADLASLGSSILQARRSGRTLSAIQLPKNSVKVKLYYSTLE